MAKVTGMFRLSGTINGRTFYVRNNKQYERKPSSLTGKRIAKEAAFAAQRQRMNDFGGASAFASIILHAWAAHLGHAAQSGLWPRLQQAVYKSVTAAPGETGRKDVSLSICVAELSGLAFVNKNRGNSKHFHPLLDNFSRRRNTLRFEMKIPGMLTVFRSRSKSTHAEITITAVTCPDFLVQKNRKARKWSFPPVEMESVDFTTGIFPLRNPPSHAQVALRLPDAPAPVQACNYVLFMTLRHFQQIGDNYYELDGSIHSQILAIL